MSDQNFEDIKSFEDREVKDKLKELENDKEFHQFIADLIYPKGNKFFSAFFQFYIKRKFIQIFGDCDSIEQFQDRMAPLVESMIAKTTMVFLIVEKRIFQTDPHFLSEIIEIYLLIQPF